MRLLHDLHLGYCTNIHRGETWEETFHGLKTYTDAVRKRVCSDAPYGIGLRLSAAAAKELASDRIQFEELRRWLDKRNAYVFTINGFPFGKFHGSRVKEQVYAPDWSSRERLDYTNLLFDLIVDLAPEGESVSVSTLPGSFKAFLGPETRQEKMDLIHKNLRACSQHIEALRDRSGRDIHLGLEPEPLGLFETSGETVEFFHGLHSTCETSESERLSRNLGVNYDTCHLAIEYEEARNALANFREAGVRISKIHLSSALRLVPERESMERLRSFEDDVYLHQVVVRDGGEITKRFTDLPDALSWFEDNESNPGDEWRVHFHVPLHAEPENLFGDTRDHIRGLLGELKEDPSLCHHFEMETYTWEVLPEAIRSRDVVEQLVAEYKWCLGEFRENGFTRADSPRAGTPGRV